VSYQANTQNTFSETAEPPQNVPLNKFDLDIEQAKEDQVSEI
jgi:hypothetical protein